MHPDNLADPAHFHLGEMKKRSSDAEDSATLLDAPATCPVDDNSGPVCVGSVDMLRCGGSGITSVLFLPSEFRSIRLYRAATWWKQALYSVLCVTSFGVLPLLAYYMPLLHAACTLTPLSSGVFATVVLVQRRDSTGSWEAVPVQRTPTTSADDGVNPPEQLIWFTFRKHRYMYDDSTTSFRRISATLYGVTSSDALRSRLTSGHSDEMAAALLRYFGRNALEIALLPAHHVLMEKLLHPFYLFQLTSVALWLYEAYWSYSILILAMTVGSVGYEVATQLLNTRKLHNFMHMDDVVVHVRRNHQHLCVPATALVVGGIL
ncbi:hypothetical protein B5M09_009446 [Aphanomyces astaci]|uniref:Cation-transporting ATPase n=1 Tax=Aphanomyces astaci TaxID=112090 RepID=A0A425CTD5_APHAT|nr:hypothetical protein B5M09_009446 [Aphanomyces astaci]